MSARQASVVAFLVLAAPRLGAQAPAEPSASVRGTVWDSVARAPLRGAVVQLVAAGGPGGRDAVAVSDSGGSFRLDRVAPGRYVVGFLHPLLDALGVELPTRPLEVGPRAAVRVALAVPAPARVRDALCGPGGDGDSTAALAGRVLDADGGRALAGSAVTVRWIDLVIAAGGVTRDVATRTATADAEGRFALCGLPLGAEVGVRAALGADSTPELTLDVGAAPLLRRDLFLAPGGARGSVRGVVVRAGDGVPLPGARVALVGADSGTTADSAGRFSLGVPAGTRALTVRALGYLPERVAVDVRAGAPAELRAALRSARELLDTVRVTARRVYSADVRGFERRRRRGYGTFLGPEQLARMHPSRTTSALRTVPGLTVRPTGSGLALLMRSPFTGQCAPSVYVDGMRIPDAAGDEVDNYVPPARLEAVEVYTSGAIIPPEYQTFNGCGAIVLWTKP